jgi:hypothetical protein
MAELGRARQVILAAIATILTANIAIISTQRADAARAQRVLAPSTTAAPAAEPAFVLFGTADTAFAAPTVFAVRGDGTNLWPSSHLPIRNDQLVGGRLSPVQTVSARVAPNANTIAFVDATGAIAFTNRAGIVVRVLPPPPGYAFTAMAWSPDSDRIAVVRAPRAATTASSGLFVMDVLGQPAHLVSRGDFRSLDWSHDGTRLAAVRADVDSDQLWVYDIEDSTGLQLSDGPSGTATFCGRTALVRPRAADPMWSPDDRQIAFLSNADHLQTFGHTFDVKVANADGSKVVTAHRAPNDACERVAPATSQIRQGEYVSLFGWVKSANMAA